MDVWLDWVSWSPPRRRGHSDIRSGALPVINARRACAMLPAHPTMAILRAAWLTAPRITLGWPRAVRCSKYRPVQTSSTTFIRAPLPRRDEESANSEHESVARDHLTKGEYPSLDKGESSFIRTGDES